MEPPGGSVVLRVFSDRAELVSATPAPGFGVQHWETADWLRVTFTSVDASHSSSVFVTWQDHPPRIETVRHDA